MDDETAEVPEYTVANRVMAGVMVLAALGLVYIGLDVMTGGAISRALSRTPEEQ
ncbi:hypothetical protein [Kitasatospora sp. NPDC057198]|uniref:hypothetical protein n=1 Tax=Kitasatospora sp. NPDC057198 TaxID=3346046 RepID=UPI00362A242D